MEDFIIERVLPVVIILMAAFLLYLMLAWLPVHLSNEADCLEMGYPKTNTTVGLKGYCMNLDGAVTGKVVPL